MTDSIFKHTRNKEIFLKQKGKVVNDEMLVRREIYNPNKFAIEFNLNAKMIGYIAASNIPLGPSRLICKPDDWLYLNHGYYIAKGVGIPDGEIISVVTNYGDSMFIGNKKVSLPGV